MALWTVHGDGRITDSETVAPEERVSWPLTIGFGVQHLVAMFGDKYRRYREQVSMLIPWPARK